MQVVTILDARIPESSRNANQNSMGFEKKIHEEALNMEELFQGS